MSMLYASDFRRIARNGLRGRWGLAIGTAIIASLLSANMGFSFPNDIISFCCSDFFVRILPYSINISSIIKIIWLFWFIIGGAVEIGYCRFNLNIVDCVYASFDDIFSKFDIFGKALLMRLLMDIYLFLWSLLFIIPGIIKCFSYAMTPYILAENPTMGVNDAITTSRQMMDGNKGRLFCLDLSFIGWSFLCAIFTLGIGYLWLVPYMNTARAVFYNEVSGRGAANNQIRQNNMTMGQNGNQG